MSSDFCNCDCCGENYYLDYITECEECGKLICNRCVIKESEDTGTDEIYIDIDDVDIDECINESEYLKKEHCPLCSSDSVSDSQRLTFLFGYLNMIAEKFNISKITIEDIDKDIINKRKAK